MSRTVESILNRHPAVRGVLRQVGAGCGGCLMARFCTLADVAAAYRLDRDHLTRLVRQAVRSRRKRRVS